MLRHIGLLTIGLAVSGIVNAGQIQIGQVVAGLNDGLSSSYVTSGCMSSSGTNYDGCATGAAGSFGLRAYNLNLMYSGMSGTLGTTPASTAAYNSASTAAVAAGSTVYDSSNQITFAMIDSSNAASSNYWSGTGNTTAITIPIGIFGVTNVWTMLNNALATNGNNTTDVTFTFASDSKGTTGVDTFTLDLVNGVEIRQSVDCSSGCASNANTTGLYNGVTNVATTNISGSVPSTVAVQAFGGTLLNESYSAATSPYNGTSGNINLDDQDFSFGSTFANDWLVSVSVKELSGSSTVSRTALSGITVQTGASSAPEPSTIFLLLGGFGSMAFVRLRRK
jgi:hypothetical protein